MAKACGFCGGPGVTKEHLWPDWLRKLILISRGGGKGRAFRAEFERDGITKRYKTTNLETRVSMPCKTCNEGWMHDIENVVKSCLGQMAVQGEKTPLDSERSLALSRWSLKVAMVFEFTGDRRYFTEDERREFKELFTMPENLWIWMGRYDGPKPVHGVERRAWAEGELVAASAYCLTVTAGFRGAAGARASQVSAAAFSTCGFDAGQYPSANLSAAERTARLASTQRD